MTDKDKREESRDVFAGADPPDGGIPPNKGAGTASADGGPAKETAPGIWPGSAAQPNGTVLPAGESQAGSIPPPFPPSDQTDKTVLPPNEGIPAPGAASVPGAGLSRQSGYPSAAPSGTADGANPAASFQEAGIQPAVPYVIGSSNAPGGPQKSGAPQAGTVPPAAYASQSGYTPQGNGPAGANPQTGGYASNGYNAGGYQPGAWQVPPQVLAQATAQSKRKSQGKPGGVWDRFTKGCKKLWKQLTSSLVVRIVCNGAVSAFAGFIAATIISAVLNLSGGVSFLFFAAFTLLIFIKMTNHTMSYVKDIAEAVGKISGGDYSVKVPEKYSDELGTLARQINQMTVELSRAREREQLEEQRKNEFITSIAHDLRTPLTSVIGYLGLISEQDGQPVEKETLVRYADVAFRKSKRLELLITQLFDFSRYNFGEIHPAENRIDLAELLEQINQEFYPQFTDRQLQSRVIISGRPVMVKGDGNMLVRVFDNILGNAVRYGASGRYIDIELYNRGTEAVVRVTNYGAEISPEDLSRIFDKFYRTDASRSSETGGAGLGMAIAKNIVEAHGGRIRAISGDGKVTFEVVLPVIAP